MYHQPLLLPNKDNTVHYCHSREREERRGISDSSCIINYQDNNYFEHFPQIIRRILEFLNYKKKQKQQK